MVCLMCINARDNMCRDSARCPYANGLLALRACKSR